jgi:cell division protein FtsI/penicillin-binding protein 2
MVSRLSLLIVFVACAYGMLLFHLYDVQLTKGGYYLARAASQYAGTDISKSNRGIIYFTDKNGNQLSAVTNKPMPVAYVVPKAIEDPAAAAQSMAEILGLQEIDLTKQLSKKNSAYALLKKKLDLYTASKVEALGMKGVYTELVPERFYPFGKLAAHLLGFVAPNNYNAGEIGAYGLEKFYENKLAGEQSENIVTTIDPNIQTEAERVLDDLVASSKSTGGSVVVEDPKTGKILAMGSVPTFDPNAYSENSVKDFLNPVAQELYEPGSVFKVITMSAGIDAGKITPETTFTDTGVLMVNGRKIQNWDLKAHGLVTMTNVIEKSLNTGAAFAERQTGHAIFRSYLSKFGFDEKTDIDVPGELAGNLRGLQLKSPEVAYATASFGQGVSVTQLELINAVAAIANGGNLMRPYVNSDRAPKTIRRVISASTAKKVTAMMTSAVDKAEVANIKGYSIAGKTGTAQVPDLVRGGYTDRVIDTYVGFGPTIDPQFIILIKINEPEGAPLAGTTVVPAFRAIAQFLLNYYNVSPDRREN